MTVHIEKYLHALSRMCASITAVHPFKSSPSERWRSFNNGAAVVGNVIIHYALQRETLAHSYWVSTSQTPILHTNYYQVHDHFDSPSDVVVYTAGTINQCPSLYPSARFSVRFQSSGDYFPRVILLLGVPERNITILAVQASQPHCYIRHERGLCF